MPNLGKYIWVTILWCKTDLNEIHIYSPCAFPETREIHWFVIFLSHMTLQTCFIRKIVGYSPFRLPFVAGKYWVPFDQNIGIAWGLRSYHRAFVGITNFWAALSAIIFQIFLYIELYLAISILIYNLNTVNGVFILIILERFRLSQNRITEIAYKWGDLKNWTWTLLNYIDFTSSLVFKLMVNTETMFY